jgi:hypothetical protein
MQPIVSGKASPHDSFDVRIRSQSTTGGINPQTRQVFVETVIGPSGNVIPRLPDVEVVVHRQLLGAWVARL